MSKILVTGATGFLGRYLVPQLKSNNLDFHALTRNPDSGRGSYTEIECDLASEIPALHNKEYDRVIHMAGLAHVVPKSKEEADRFISNNVNATENLLTSLSRTNNIPKHFTFISTVAVYGLDYGSMITEKQNKSPYTPYGKSKLACEIMLKKWCEDNAVKLLILRPSLIVGYAAKGNLLRMENAIKKRTYVRIANNKTLKSVVHAIPLCELIIGGHALEGSFNVSDGSNPTFEEVENTYAAMLHRRIYISIPLWLLKPIVYSFDKISLLGISVPVTSDILNKVTLDLTFDAQKLTSRNVWHPIAALTLLKREFETN